MKRYFVSLMFLLLINLSFASLVNHTLSQIIVDTDLNMSNYNITDVKKLFVIGGADSLQLGPGDQDHVYIEFFGDTQFPNQRFAWVGYGSAGSTTFIINNEVGTNTIRLMSNVTIDSSLDVNSGTLYAGFGKVGIGGIPSTYEFELYGNMLITGNIYGDSNRHLVALGSRASVSYGNNEFLVYSYGSTKYGITLGYGDDSEWRTRVFAPSPGRDVCLSTYTTNTDSQSNFIDILCADTDSYNVGIGTISPREKLEVNGNILVNASGGEKRIEFDTGLPNYIGFFGRPTDGVVGMYDWNNSLGVWYYFPSSKAFYIYRNLYLDSGRLEIKTTPSHEIVFTGSTTANIYQNVDGGILYINTNNGPIYLGNSNGAQTLSIVSGNVGIGTSSPSYKLHVSGTGYFSNQLIVDGGYGALKLKPGSADHVFIEFYGNSSNPGQRFAWVGYGSAGSTTFIINNEVGTNTIRLMSNVLIDTSLNVNAGNLYVSGGKVGIGTTSPGYTLDVNGDIATRGELYLAGGSNSDIICMDNNCAIESNNAAGAHVYIWNRKDNHYILDANVDTNDITLYDSLYVNGNLGVGTNSPQAKLHVLGNVNITTSTGWPVFYVGPGDTNGQVEFRGNKPYIDFSNDGTTDYDMRIQLEGNDELKIMGGQLTVADKLAIGNVPSLSDNNKVLTVDGSGKVSYIDTSSWDKNSGDDITGSGTAGYIAKFTGTQTIGDSVIYENGGNVGIGTSSPTEKLDVNGNILVRGNNIKGNTGSGSLTFWTYSDFEFKRYSGGTGGDPHIGVWDETNSHYIRIWHSGSNPQLQTDTGEFQFNKPIQASTNIEADYNSYSMIFGFDTNTNAVKPHSKFTYPEKLSFIGNGYNIHTLSILASTFISDVSISTRRAAETTTTYDFNSGDSQGWTFYEQDYNGNTKECGNGVVVQEGPDGSYALKGYDTGSSYGCSRLWCIDLGSIKNINYVEFDYKVASTYSGSSVTNLAITILSKPEFDSNNWDTIVSYLSLVSGGTSNTGWKHTKMYIGAPGRYVCFRQGDGWSTQDQYFWIDNVKIDYYSIKKTALRVFGKSYFDDSIGIGTYDPVEKLDVEGAIKIGDTSSSCDANHRGVIKFVKGASGVNDKIYVCMKSSSGTYNWILIGSG